MRSSTISRLSNHQSASSCSRLKAGITKPGPPPLDFHLYQSLIIPSPPRTARRSTASVAPGSPPGSHSRRGRIVPFSVRRRSEEHTSELQSLRHLVCRLLLEKK